jgi:hypothetical protein
MKRAARVSTVLTAASLVAVTAWPLPPDGQGAAAKAPHGRRERRPQMGEAGDETTEALAAAEQFAQARRAPGVVRPGAYSAGLAALGSLPVSGRAWSEVTTRPYDVDDPRYRDPVASNSSGGWGFASGRVTGIAVGGGALYVGGVGGVFRSLDSGASWAPLTDGIPALSVGDLRLAPDGALWLATGEAGSGTTAFVGTGVYRLARPRTAVFALGDRVGGVELEGTSTGKLRFDGFGAVYAATSQGVWKHAAGTRGGAWRRVLSPSPEAADEPDLESADRNACHDVAVDPSSGGQRVIANCAWREEAATGGFYLSTDGGETFRHVEPGGALHRQEIGRSSLAYARDGSRLYALVERVGREAGSEGTALRGVYVSASGSVAGPWARIATSASLGDSGSALHSATFYHPGIQARYNQFLDVDPDDPDHVFVGLEEVYETTDGGVQWDAVGAYWNFDFECWSTLDGVNTCPPTTHPDQHAIAIAAGKVYVGNDGGLFARPLRGSVDARGHATDWQNLNAGLRTLQYYSVGVGRVPGGVAVSGGLQDNGGSLLLPEDGTGAGKMGSPFGGDGGDVLVDPSDGCRILQEYVFLAMQVTETCGRSDGSFASVRDVDPHDPHPRFVAPFEADTALPGHWVAGGQYVWVNTRGFAIQSGADWVPVFNNGAGRSTTVVASQNDVIWSAWCGPCDPDSFARGLSTNVGGTWRQLPLPPRLPNRYVSGLVMDPADASGRTVYVGFNGFSRRWTEGAGAGLGHLWKTTDGGVTWANVSGNMPDLPVNDVLIGKGKLVVATDLGVIVSTSDGASWSRLGSNLPYTTVFDVHAGPDGRLYAATHGRGIWSIAQP